jgi:hypothetical protein
VRKIANKTTDFIAFGDENNGHGHRGHKSNAVVRNRRQQPTGGLWLTPPYKTNMQEPDGPSGPDHVRG